MFTEDKLGLFNKMNLILKLTLSTILIFSLSSCLAPRESSPVNTYDLGQAEQTGIKLNISSIDQNGPYNSRMLFRVSPEKIEINEFERWTQSPDLVLNNYLKRAFLPGGDFMLEGEIIAFENDLVNEQAIFTFHYKVTKIGNIVASGIFEGKTKSTEDPEEYAHSMASLAKELIKNISQKLKKL